MRMAESHVPVTYIHNNDDTIFTVSGDRYIRTYNFVSIKHFQEPAKRN